MELTPEQLVELSQRLRGPAREQMPWERMTTTPVFDAYGSWADKPEVRQERQLERDRAQAGAELQARISDRRPWETPEDIAEEVNLKYGLQMPGQRNKLPPLVKAGSTVLTPNERGELEVAYQEPRVEKPVKHRVPFKVNMLGEPSEYVSMTEDEIIEAVNSKSLPEAAAQSEVVKYVTSRMRPQAAVNLPSRSEGISFAGTRGGVNLFQSPGESGSGFIGAPGGTNSFRKGYETISRDITGAAPSAKTKAQLANQIAAQNPTWSRARIISEVNKQFSR